MPVAEVENQSEDWLLLERFRHPGASISEGLREVGRIRYDYRASGPQPAIGLLLLLADRLPEKLPPQYKVLPSLGVGPRPRGLWLAILDPDVTYTPTQGIYVVFLFNESRTTVSLSLNQGVTAATARARHENRKPRDLLEEEAAVLRGELAKHADVTGLDIEVELGTGQLVRKYEAGNIFAKTWKMEDVPPESELLEHIDRFLLLYRGVVERKEELLLSASGSVRTPARAARPVRAPEFKPKSSSPYSVTVSTAEQVRQRSHELVVEKLGMWAISRGFVANTRVHPRDLMIDTPQGSLLVEVKVIPVGESSADAVRMAIGQLFEYRRFHAPDCLAMIAAFSESPGTRYLDLMAELGIGAIWPDNGRWTGSPAAQTVGLVE